MERLRKHPLAQSPMPGDWAHLGARKVQVKKFPYTVIFVEEGDPIWVVAFAHHRRRPGYWRDRIR